MEHDFLYGLDRWTPPAFLLLGAMSSPPWGESWMVVMQTKHVLNLNMSTKISEAWPKSIENHQNRKLGLIVTPSPKRKKKWTLEIMGKHHRSNHPGNDMICLFVGYNIYI